MAASLRVRLLVWHALIMAGVLTAFLAVWLHELGRSRELRLDEELRGHALAVGASVERGPVGGYELDLPDAELDYFAGGTNTPGEAPYYVVWTETGSVIAGSTSDAEQAPARPLLRTRSGRREVVIRGKAGTLVLVGRGASTLSVRDLGGKAVLAAGVALALAFVGGYFLTSRALAPIDRISRAAARISEVNLSERIDVGRTEAELENLAQTLNVTFARLHAAFERHARFTADASHELRTPLSVVITQAESALRRERQGEDYRKALEAVLRAGRRMQGVVDGLLTLARADAGALRVEKEPLELLELARETAALLGKDAEARDVRVLVTGPETWVLGDGHWLGEVMGNLLSNAIRYNHQGGEAEIRLAHSNDVAVLEIRDGGPGIAEEDRPRVFDRFFRADKGRSRRLGGSGLGLPISKWIVEAHGGSIEVVSEPSPGAVFRVKLPGRIGGP